MVFSRIISSIVGLTALSAALVATGPIELVPRTNHINSPSSTTAGSCNVGEAQCCQSIHQSNDQSFQFLTSILGLSLPIDGLMAGIQCSPILNIASLADASSCNSQPICCTGNHFSGLVNVGCSPLTL